MLLKSLLVRLPSMQSISSSRAPLPNFSHNSSPPICQTRVNTVIKVTGVSSFSAAPPLTPSLYPSVYLSAVLVFTVFSSVQPAGGVMSCSFHALSLCLPLPLSVSLSTRFRLNDLAVTAGFLIK